jgi:hypothetical protein
MVDRLPGAARSLLPAGHLSGLKGRLLLGLILRAKVDRNAVVAEFTPYQ